VRGRQYFLSIAAGLLTPFPLLTLLTFLQSAGESSGTPPPEWTLTLFAGFLFALALALWPRIHPLWYGAALPPGFFVWCFIMAGAGRSGNLFGLAVIIFFLAGALIGGAAALCGWLARRWPLPRWAPAVPLLAACLIVILGQQLAARKAGGETTAIRTLLGQIRAAEQSYAAARPDRAYTCNGPDLRSIAGIDWHTDYNLGGFDRNQGQYADYWIRLHCPPSADPSFVTVTADALWPGGPHFTFDSRSGAIAPGNPSR
jgi:hypothetical protein